MQNRIFDVYVPALCGIAMLVILTIRYAQLKNTGYHQYRQYNATLKIRVFLLILCVLLTLTINYISILNPKFYLYKSDYSQIFMFMCIVYSTQVACIIYEYNKNVPIMFIHKIFWTICLITNSIQAILIGLNSNDDFDILSNIVLYLIIFDQFSLNIFSFFIRKQDKFEFEEISGLAMNVPDYQDIRQQMIPIQNSFIGLSSSHSQFKCTIHFSKTWKIVQQKDGQIDAIITLKIFLSNPNKHYQLKKTINDFVILESQLQQEDKFGFEIYKLPNEFFNHGPDSHQMFTEKIGMIKIWLRQMISKIEYLTPSIFDFLEFDDAIRACIMKEQRFKSNSVDQNN